MVDVFIEQNRLFIPGFKVYYGTTFLSNYTDNLINDIKIKEGDNLIIEGLFYPLPSHLDYMENNKVYISKKCIICLNEYLNITYIFKCGHVNVCNDCLVNVGIDKCPICK